MQLDGVQVVVAWMAFVAVFGFVLLGWGIYSGQLDDLENTKFIPFQERDPEGWPAGPRAAKEV